MIVFKAKWCVACKEYDKTLTKFREKNPHIKVRYVDIDEEPDVAARYDIDALPTTVFIKDGAEVDRKVGSITLETLSAVLTKLGCVITTLKIGLTIFLFLL